MIQEPYDKFLCFHQVQCAGHYHQWLQGCFFAFLCGTRYQLLLVFQRLDLSSLNQGSVHFACSNPTVL